MATTLTAGDLSNPAIISSDTTGAVTIQTGAAGAKVNALSLSAAGIPTFNQLAQSLGTTGYKKLDGGLIIQWGVSPTITQNAQVTVTLPIPFPNAAFVGVASSNNTYLASLTDTALQVAVTTTNIIIGKGQNGGGAAHDAAAYWIALGY